MNNKTSPNKITVLMSTYNGEKHLKEQIDTILAQDIEGLSLFVRDDGSTDSTCEILEKYANTGKLTYYKGEQKEEYFNTLSKVGFSFLDLVKKAPESEYYAFADQDDIWLENKLSEAVKLLEAHDNQDTPLLYCSYATLVDENGIETKAKAKKATKNATRVNQLLVQGLSLGCTFVFNKFTQELFSKYNPPYMITHDYDLLKIVSAIGKIVYDGRSFIKYRQHSVNVVGGKKRSIFSRIKKSLKTKSFHSLSAENILNDYSDLMQDDVRQLFELVAYYKKSFKKKMKLLFTNKIQRGDIKTGILFKIGVLINKL